MPKCVSTKDLEAYVGGVQGVSSQQVADIARELLSARKTLAKRVSDKEDVIETLTKMMDDAWETHRAVTTKEDLHYWQGVKDGLRKSLILIETDDEARDLYRGILETSASGNRPTLKEQAE